MIYYGRSRETRADSGFPNRLPDGAPLSPRYVKNGWWAKQATLNVLKHLA